MTLGEFLLRETGSRAPWNCSTMAADWCMVLGHPDFARRWRHIVTERASNRVARRGLVRLWHKGIQRALPIVEAPYQAGDIAVVTAHGHEAGAIFTGERWALGAERGLVFASADSLSVLKAWRP